MSALRQAQHGCNCNGIYPVVLLYVMPDCHGGVACPDTFRSLCIFRSVSECRSLEPSPDDGIVTVSLSHSDLAYEGSGSFASGAAHLHSIMARGHTGTPPYCDGSGREIPRRDGEDGWESEGDAGSGRHTLQACPTLQPDTRTGNRCSQPA